MVIATAIFEGSAPHYRGMDGLRSKVYWIDAERGEFGGFYLWESREQMIQVQGSAEWLAARAAEGYRAGPGQFGEQLIVEGLAVETLPAGTMLALGPEAIIAITKGRTGCERLQAVQPRPTTGLGPIGVLARVVMGGPIRVGDAVRVLEPAAERAA